MRRWEERWAYFLDEARRDLTSGEEVRPCLVVLAGEERLFLAFVRSFGRGGLYDAVVELLALAGALGADRLALSLPGRAWSLQDPVAPVVPGVADLRQRVLVIEESDGTAGAPRGCTLAIPYDVEDGVVRWGEPLGGGQWVGSLAGALAGTIAARQRLRASDREVRRQAQRCVAAGHLLAVGPTLADRLAR